MCDVLVHAYGDVRVQVWWAASDIGWVVGHSYIVYAPLAAQCTTVLYEGKPVGTPNASSFFRVLAQHRVNGAFYAPTALRAIRREVHSCIAPHLSPLAPPFAPFAHSPFAPCCPTSRQMPPNIGESYSRAAQYSNSTLLDRRQAPEPIACLCYYYFL